MFRSFLFLTTPNTPEESPMVFDTAILEEEKAGLQEEMNMVAELIQQCINENARIAINQTDYQTRYDALAERFEKAKDRLETVSMETTEKQAHRESTERFMAELSRMEGVITNAAHTKAFPRKPVLCTR